MNPAEFANSTTGRLVPTIQNCLAFVPHPLPPNLIDLGVLVGPIAKATRALGELSGVGRTLQNPYLLIRPFMRKEAVASSRIEGTVTTLSELFLFEVDELSRQTSSDAREVHNYVRALEYTINGLSELPISGRMIKQAHKILLTGVGKHRGSAIIPGEFKRDQSWIGARLIQNARYVPPPPVESEEAFSQLEIYINKLSVDDELPLVVQLAFIHYQFEAIHPFPDGNGRLGRLLIPLLLAERKEMSQPLLYMSTYFETNYDTYIDTMLDVSKHGRWEQWIQFFLRGVEEVSRDAIEKAQRLQDLHNAYQEKIRQARSSALLGRIVSMLFEHPALSISLISSRLEITYNAAKNNVQRLIEHGILSQSTTASRPMTFLANEIIEILIS